VAVRSSSSDHTKAKTRGLEKGSVLVLSVLVPYLEKYISNFLVVLGKDLVIKVLEDINEEAAGVDSFFLNLVLLEKKGLKRLDEVFSNERGNFSLVKLHVFSCNFHDV